MNPLRFLGKKIKLGGVKKKGGVTQDDIVQIQSLQSYLGSKYAHLSETEVQLSNDLKTSDLTDLLGSIEELIDPWVSHPTQGVLKMSEIKTLNPQVAKQRFLEHQL